MCRFSRAALALWCWWLAGAHAQETEQQREQEPVPDLDFLEYLGTWADEDDEWLAIETWERDVGEDADADENEEPKEPESNGNDDDESE